MGLRDVVERRDDLRKWKESGTKGAREKHQHKWGGSEHGGLEEVRHGLR